MDLGLVLLILPNIAVFVVVVLVLSGLAFGDRYAEDVQFAARGVLVCFAGILVGVVAIILAPSFLIVLVTAVPAIGVVVFAWLLNDAAQTVGLRVSLPPGAQGADVVANPTACSDVGADCGGGD
jgi:hypothetical protein